MSIKNVKWLLLMMVILIWVCVSWFKMPMTKAADETDFLTFHHPPMGLTLSYPADWRLETRDSIPTPPPPEYLPEGYSSEGDTEGNKTFANNVTLYAATVKEKPFDVVYISIDSIRISPSGDLSAIVALKNESAQFTSPLDSRTVTTQTLDGVDAAIIVSTKGKLGQSEAFWLAKDGLIYSIATASDNPDVIAMMHEIVARFQFDGTTKELYEKYQKYTVDADGLRIANEALRPKPPLECDIVCRDQKERGDTPNLNTSASPSTSTQNQTPLLQAAAVNAVSGLQKALPANWQTPILPVTNPPTWNVQCGSDFHANQPTSDGSEFALDIGATQGRPVYAVIGGTVRTRDVWDGTSQGYGNTVVIETAVNTAGESRTYYHRYAHLQAIDAGVVLNQPIANGAQIGTVGSSGAGNAIHLHFHVRDASYNPVELTPLLGFSPNLYYPNDNDVSCGSVDYQQNDTIVVESVAFTARLNQGAAASDASAKYWWCINPAGATVECYMKADYPTNAWFTQVTSTSPPQLQYNNIQVFNNANQNPTTFYIWTCGHASTGGDDSIWVDSESKVVSIVQTPQWTWLSHQFNTNGRPTIPWSSGNRTLNVWIREDAARFSRILLARNATYNPNGVIRCGPY